MKNQTVLEPYRVSDLSHKTFCQDLGREGLGSSPFFLLTSITLHNCNFPPKVIK